MPTLDQPGESAATDVTLAVGPAVPGARSQIEHWASPAGPDAAAAIAGLGLLLAQRSRIPGVGVVPGGAPGWKRRPTVDAHVVAAAISSDVAARARRPGAGRSRVTWSLGAPVRKPAALATTLASISPLEVAGLTSRVRDIAPLDVIEIDPSWLDLGTLAWLASEIGGQLFAPAVIAAPRMGTNAEFQWPIRLGFLDDRSSRQVASALERHVRRERPWVGNLVDIRFPSGPEEAIDILLVPHRLDAAIEAISAVPHGLDAAVLLVTRGSGHAAARSPEGLRRELHADLDPSAVVIVEVAEGATVPWFVEIVRQLSHDRTLDEAVWDVLGHGPTSNPLVIGDPAALDRMRVRRAAMAAIESLPTANGGDAVELAEPEAVSFGLPPAVSAEPIVVPRQVLRARVAADESFVREGLAATATSLINRRRPPQPVAAATPRWIVARVGHRTPGRVVTVVEDALRPRTRYVLDFLIGAPREGWHAANEAFPDVLPRDGKRHLLRVVFQSGEQRAPIVRHVELPPVGDSSPCQFPFRTSNGTRYRGRIIVQFRNRVIQTAIVSAGISDGTATGRAAGVRVTVESVIRPGLADLSRRRAFDLAVVHNHDEDGKPTATGLSGDWAEKFKIGRVQDLAGSIKRLLDRVAAAPDTYKALTDPPTTELMYALALAGVEIRKTLFPKGPPWADPAGRTPRVQVVAADPSAYFPLEFIYDFPPPAAPVMCKNAATALADGHCDPAKYHHENPNRTIDVVCPIGFWSLSRVIERHVTPDDWVPDLLGYDFGLRSEPVTGRDLLGGLASAVFACSDRVTVPDADTVDRALAAATKTPSTRVRTWGGWIERVEKDAPDLLLLLAHTARDAAADQPALSIEAGVGTDQSCLAPWLNEVYVRLDEPESVRSKPGPLVFLLGCDTARPWLEYLSFVVRFRNNRAALVVGTVATVPAAHAANVARQLIGELSKRLAGGQGAGGPAPDPPEAFGDLLLAARRSIVAGGEVVGMCLTSYGDADWKFG